LIVDSLAFSPDGKTLAAGGQYNVRLWDTTTGMPIREFTPRPPRINSVAFSPDGKILAAGGKGGVYLWQVRTGQLLHRFVAHTGGTCTVAFAPDGRRLASAGGDGVIALWDIMTGKVTHRYKGHRKTIRSVTFSPGGERIASASQDGTIRLWNTKTGRELWQAGDQVNEVLSLAFSPDGKTLASGSVDRTDSLRLWEAATGKEIRRYRLNHVVWSVQFSPNGKRLALTCGSLVRLWNVETGQEINPQVGHQGSIHCVTFSPDGRQLVSGSSDETIRVWDVSSAKEVYRLDVHPDSALCLAFSPDGRTLASGGNAIRLWDPSRRKLLREFTANRGGVGSLAFSPDGKTLAAGSGIGKGLVYLLEVRSGKCLHRVPVDVYLGCVGVVFSRDGKTVLARAGNDLNVLDVVSGKKHRALAVELRASSFVATPADRRGVVSLGPGKQGAIILWDFGSLRPLREFTTFEYPRQLFALSRDGKILAARDGLWEIASGTQFFSTLSLSQSNAEALAFAPNGRILAVGGRDGAITLWDLPKAINDGKVPAGQLTLAEIRTAWTELGDQQASRGYRAVWALVAAQHQALALLRQQLRPVQCPKPEHIARLVTKLDDDNSTLREHATSELEQLAELVEEALRTKLAGKVSLEGRSRIEQVLQTITKPIKSSEKLRALRGIVILEQIGSPAAQEILQRLARGAPASEITKEAQAALDRLR
jgi:WD40 repeat protein